MEQKMCKNQKAYDVLLFECLCSLDVHRSWQGLVLDCSPLEWEPLDEFPAADSVAGTDGSRPPVWLALDEIGDPVSSCCMHGHTTTVFPCPWVPQAARRCLYSAWVCETDT